MSNEAIPQSRNIQHVSQHANTSAELQRLWHNDYQDVSLAMPEVTVAIYTKLFGISVANRLRLANRVPKGL